MRHYGAPWSTSLIMMSIVSTVISLCLSVAVWWGADIVQHGGLLRWIALAPMVLLLGCALSTVRGYSLSADRILVRRLLWSTVLPRTGLKSAEVEPDAMLGSLRTLGNGGAFSFTGLFHNQRLGSYRAYVTDPHRTVVLRYAHRRVVLSPAAPEDLVHDLALAKA